MALYIKSFSGRYVNGTLLGNNETFYEKKISLIDGTMVRLQLWDVNSHEDHCEGLNSSILSMKDI